MSIRLLPFDPRPIVGRPADAEVPPFVTEKPVHLFGLLFRWNDVVAIVVFFSRP